MKSTVCVCALVVMAAFQLCAKPGETYILTGKERGVDEVVKADMQQYPESYTGETFSSYFRKFKSENKIGRKRYKPGDELFFPHTLISSKAKVKGMDGKVSKRSTGSCKKGFGIVPGKFPDWQQRLQLLNVGWYYGWNPNIPIDGPLNSEFVPMVLWTGKKMEQICRKLEQQKKESKCKHLLGYNEPNVIKNWLNEPMSIQEGIDAWPHLMKTGLRLGSPSPNKKGLPWLAEFMSEIDDKGYRVDFICVHWYATGDPNQLIGFLQRLYETYDLPIWLTEFCLADWGASPGHPSKYDAKDARRFMKAALSDLENLDFVERYAWFSTAPDDPKLGASALFNKDGTLTELGRIYSSY